MTAYSIECYNSRCEIVFLTIRAWSEEEMKIRIPSEYYWLSYKVV